MLVILMCVTSTPSAALREITNPLVVCTSSVVAAFVTLGVFADSTTVKPRSSVLLVSLPTPAVISVLYASVIGRLLMPLVAGAALSTPLSSLSTLLSGSTAPVIDTLPFSGCAAPKLAALTRTM